MENKSPIFIHGIMKRSGTNFLCDLVCLHPDCVPTGISENFFLENADILKEYVDATKAQMVVEGDPGERARIKERLCEYLGEGLIRFLGAATGGRAEEGKRMVAKTPSGKNLELFSDLFPWGKMLIIVRDGRAVVESYAKSYGWTNYECLMRRWAEAAGSLVEFDRKTMSCDREYLIVKYEHLYRDTEKEMRRILGFLGLDPALYDFKAAGSLPVRGSSVFRGGKENLHWDPVEKTPEFDPLARASGWGKIKRERFDWVAGRGMKELGYEEGKSPAGRSLWIVWNSVMDLAVKVRMMGKDVTG